MADVLSTEGWSPKFINKMILTTESAHPDLKEENQRIRALVTQDAVLQVVSAEHIDIDAALMSTCRSDMLRCGRCAFWNALVRAGVHHGEL